MANGDLIKLGTLYVGGSKKTRPTKPWQIGTTPPGASGPGDVPSYTAGQTIEIRDTDPNDSYQIQWREVNDGDKKLLISDRVLLAYVSWDDLNAQGLVSGKTITIDGQQYKLRVLTGGSNYRSGTDAYSGGSPAANEWDRIIVNEAGFSGLPTPAASDLNSTADSADFSGAHNQYWNWFYMYSWAQEVYTGNSAVRAIRGNSSARSWYGNASSNRYYNFGWRPVLEVLNSVPSVTLTNPSDNQILTEENTLQVAGSATDSDSGNVVTIKYKINNSTPRALQSGVSNGSTPISFAKSLTYSNKRLWDGSTDVTGVDLAENTDHTLTVWVEDDQGGKSAEVTRNFQVIWNRPPTISGQNDSLGTITDRPTITYSAVDPEGNTFTFTEYLNGQQVRSFTGEAGQEYTFQLTHDAWIRLDLDVPHQAKIVATDSAGMSSERVYTFTRTETHIEFMLDYDNPDVQAFFTVDGMPKRILVTLERYLPPGSSIESVRVTNNYLDAQPTWEDATGAVIGGRGYLFTNTTKTADNWAVCVWVTIAKGSADQRVHVYGYGGAFD